MTLASLGGSFQLICGHDVILVPHAKEGHIWQLCKKIMSPTITATRSKFAPCNFGRGTGSCGK